ncbi:MAG: Calx-beta domain-containing protein [Pseudomonadota bacterium]
MNGIRLRARFLAGLLITTGLAACGQTTEPDPEPNPDPEPVPATYSVSINVSGTGGDTVAIVLSPDTFEQTLDVSDGRHTFPESLADDTTFGVYQDVSARPDLACVINLERAAIRGADVDIDITCSAAVYVGGSVSGLEGTPKDSLNNLALRLTSTSQPFPGLLEYINENGEFEFGLPIQSGDEYLVEVERNPMGPEQVCTPVILGGTADSAQIDDIDLTCETLYSLTFSAEDVLGSGGIVTLSVENDDPARNRVLTTALVNGDDQGFAGDEAKLWPGERYSVTVSTSPNNPEQRCRIDDGTGTVADSDIANVRITCGDSIVGGTVEGLHGSGLVLQLARTVSPNGNTQLIVVERLPIEESGEFRFETLLDDGETYEIDIDTQPSNPNQDCTVDNGNPTVSQPEMLVTTIACPGPARYYRYDNNLTFIDSDGALLEEEVEFGVVSNQYEFDNRPVPAMGRILGLTDTPLFERLDADGQQGEVYSSESGRTYWLAAEAPVGNPFATETSLYAHHVTLDTLWSLRKSRDDASVTLELTQIYLGAYDAGHPSSIDGRLLATAEIRVRGIIPGATVDDDETFHHAYSRIWLEGAIDPDDPLAQRHKWGGFSVGDAEAPLPVVPDDKLFINTTAGVPSEVGRTEQAALVRLAEPVLVEIDLTNVPVGADFEVLVETIVEARNDYSGEGGAVAYLRDPAEIDLGAEDASVAFVLEGVEMLEPNPERLQRPATGGPVPEPCSAGSNVGGTLAFSQSAYTVSESEDEGVPIVFIERTGGTDGLVSAAIEITPITATPGEDYEERTLTVRFGDGESSVTALDLPLIDDLETEDAETFELTLTSPAGCVDIGAQSTALVTIAPNDPSAGTIAFTSADFAVNEDAGFATVSVERVGGSFGIVAVNVVSRDGSAVDSVDYRGINARIVYQDGEAGERFLQIPILDNAEIDPDRTVLLTIAEDSGVPGEPSSATLTIINDDEPQPGTLQFSEPTYSVSEDAGSITVAVTREGGTAGDIAVDFRTLNGSAIAGEDYAETIATLQFADRDATAKEVTITIIDDSDVEGDHGFNVRLDNATGGATLGTNWVVPITIFDDDAVSMLPPAAPALGVNADFKALSFDWQTVADTRYYRLRGDLSGSGAFAQIGVDIPIGETALRLPVAAHLIDLNTASFVLQACNDNGCTDSNIVDTDALRIATIGFVKASNTEGLQQTGEFEYFGWAVDVASDGRTFAVSAYNEASNATFVNGDQTDNSALRSGAVYVFTEDTTGWFQQAYIKASNTNPGDHFGDSLALSADGNTLAIAASDEDGASSGVNGDDTTIGNFGSGAIYVYVRTGNVWQLEAYIKASDPDSADAFGRSLALSDDGNTLVAGAPNEDSSGVGVGADASDNTANDSGAVYVFSRSGTDWVQSAYIKASNTEADDRFGSKVALSRDGTTLAVTAQSEDSAARGVGGDQSDNSAPGVGSVTQGTGAVYVFSFDSGTWVQEAYVKSSNLDADDRFGRSLALSANGDRLVVGAFQEDSSATGVNSTDEVDNSLDAAGAAYVFTRSGGSWSQEAYLKASNTDRSTFFGAAVDLDASGDVLVVGAFNESSLATGVNGSQALGPIRGVGAAYLFERDSGTGLWQQRSYVKPTNSDQNPDFPGFGRLMRFGEAVALSATGEVLIIGATGEPSAATGINGDQVNQDADYSGAAYVY